MSLRRCLDCDRWAVENGARCVGHARASASAELLMPEVGINLAICQSVIESPPQCSISDYPFQQVKALADRPSIRELIRVPVPHFEELRKL